MLKNNICYIEKETRSRFPHRVENVDKGANEIGRQMVSAAAAAATDRPTETTPSAVSRFVRTWKDHLFRTERQAIAGPVDGARSVKVLNARVGWIVKSNAISLGSTTRILRGKGEGCD